MDVGCLNKLLKLIQICLFNCFAGHPVSVFLDVCSSMIHDPSIQSQPSYFSSFLECLWVINIWIRLDILRILPLAKQLYVRSSQPWTNRSIFVCSKMYTQWSTAPCHDVSCSSMVIQVHVDLYIRSPDELQRRHRRSMCFSAAGIQVIKHRYDRYASMSCHAKVAHRRDMGHIRLCRM